MMLKGNVFVMAGGDGVTTPYLNTIEKKVHKSTIVSILETENECNDIKEIQESEEESFSIWGYSDRDKHLKGNPPKSGDIIFITKNNAAIYLATVFKVIEAKGLDFIWAGRQSWKYKLILKNVIRIFIPYPVGVDIEKWCEMHSFAPSLSKIQNINKIYKDSKIGFRHIIGKQLKTGPIQGALKIEIPEYDKTEEEKEMKMRDIEIVLSRLDAYCGLTHFECIVKEV
ncbi:hypothetical protein PCY08_06780 [Streptococcus sp. SO4]|nr:hypothetical protein [Streptococcus sp. SO4]